MYSPVTVSTVVRSFEKDIRLEENVLRDAYSLEKCKFHRNKSDALTIEAWKLLCHELREFTAPEIDHSIRQPSRAFQEATRGFSGRKAEKSTSRSPCVPLLFDICHSSIRVEIARAECVCRHVFHVTQDTFYEIIRASTVPSVDIRVGRNAKEMFEFVAFTLPGSWLRELRSLNIVFEEQCHVEPLSTLLTKSRNLGRLRVAQLGECAVKVSDVIGSMKCLEALELHSPRGSLGFQFDPKAFEMILELEKRNGAQKPFRSLKTVNTSLQLLTAQELIQFCTQLSRFEHNKNYEQFESLLEIDGRGLGAEGADDEHAIRFEVSPLIPKHWADSVARAVRRESRSWRADNVNPSKPTRRSFLVNDSLFHLFDHN